MLPSCIGDNFERICSVGSSVGRSQVRRPTERARGRRFEGKRLWERARPSVSFVAAARRLCGPSKCASARRRQHGSGESNGEVTATADTASQDSPLADPGI